MNNPSDSSSSISSILADIAKLFKDHKPLLLSYSMAVILLAAGAFAVEKLRLILGGILLLTVVGMISWIVIELRKKNPADTHTPTKTSSGDINIGKAKIIKGKITTSKVTQNAQSDITKSGDINIEDGAIIDTTTVSSGAVNSGSNLQEEKSKNHRENRGGNHAK